MANIEQWGIEKLYFALFDEESETISYQTPVSHPGAVSLSVTPGESDANRDAADNGEYFNGSGAANITGEIEVVKFTDWFKTNILGFFSEGGGIGEGDGAKKHFAMLFEVDGENGGKRIVWYDCVSSDISTTYTTTDADGAYTFAHETATITGRMIKLGGGTKRRAWSCESGSANFDGFFNAVYVPTATSGQTGQ